MALVAPVENGKYVGKTPSSDAMKPKNNDLGYDQFLQLLCAEMQYQDPLEPTSNTDYVAQLATFSQMEATLNMQNTLQNNNANDLVGKYVLVRTTSNITGETSADAGFVDYIQYEDGKQFLYINGNRYALSDVYQVIDPEYMEATTVADAFKAGVLELPEPDDLTMGDLLDVDNLCTVFNSLTSYQKAMIDEETMTRYQNLVTKANDLVLRDFENQIKELPNVDELTVEKKDALAVLQATYKAFNAYQMNRLDPEVKEKFEALVAKMEELAGSAEEE